MRENKLRATFGEQLSRAAVAEEVSSKREAKRLAYYLFWNVRPEEDRCPGYTACSLSTG